MNYAISEDNKEGFNSFFIVVGELVQRWHLQRLCLLMALKNVIRNSNNEHQNKGNTDECNKLILCPLLASVHAFGEAIRIPCFDNGGWSARVSIITMEYLSSLQKKGKTK